MRLLGAKEFLKTVKPGTLCLEFWCKDEKECASLIKDFLTNASIYSLIAQYCGEFYIFGDNVGSLSFLCDSLNSQSVTIEGVEYDCLFYYDKNIVGDANPYLTLQLVFDSEEEWPEETPVEGSSKNLTKQDIKRIQKWFIKTQGPFRDESSDNEQVWALKYLIENDNNDEIVNFKGER